MRNLKYLAPFSSIANCVTIVSFGIIAYYIFRDPIELDGRRAVGSLKEFPLFFGTVLFALEAIGVVSIRANRSTITCATEANPDILICRFCPWKTRWKPRKHLAEIPACWTRLWRSLSSYMLVWVCSVIWTMVPMLRDRLHWIYLHKKCKYFWWSSNSLQFKFIYPPNTAIYRHLV